MEGGHDVEWKAVGGGNAERLAYSPAEVAAACGLSRKAIYRAIANDELRAARVCGGSRLLISAEEVRAWVARAVAPPESAPRVEIDFARRRVARTPLRDALKDGCAT